MAKTIQIVEEASRTLSFTESLEERARDLTKDWKGSWYSEKSTVIREISLTLELIECKRSLERKTRSELSQEHFYTYRELVQQKLETWYRPYRPNSIDQLKSHLQRIDRERRTLETAIDEFLSRLHDRLLFQVNKLVYLQGGNGNRMASQKT